MIIQLVRNVELVKANNPPSDNEGLQAQLNRIDKRTGHIQDFIEKLKTSRIKNAIEYANGLKTKLVEENTPENEVEIKEIESLIEKMEKSEKRARIEEELIDKKHNLEKAEKYEIAHQKIVELLTIKIEYLTPDEKALLHIYRRINEKPNERKPELTTIQLRRDVVALLFRKKDMITDDKERLEQYRKILETTDEGINLEETRECRKLCHEMVCYLNVKGDLTNDEKELLEKYQKAHEESNESRYVEALTFIRNEVDGLLLEKRHLISDDKELQEEYQKMLEMPNKEVNLEKAENYERLRQEIIDLLLKKGHLTDLEQELLETYGRINKTSDSNSRYVEACNFIRHRIFYLLHKKWDIITYKKEKLEEYREGLEASEEVRILENVMERIKLRHEVLELLAESGALEDDEAELLKEVQKMFKSQDGVSESGKNKALEIIKKLSKKCDLTTEEEQWLKRLQEKLEQLAGKIYLSDEERDVCLKSAQEFFEMLGSRRIRRAEIEIHTNGYKKMIKESLDKKKDLLKNEREEGVITRLLIYFIDYIWRIEKVRKEFQEIAREIILLIDEKKDSVNAVELNRSICNLINAKRELHKNDERYRITIGETENFLDNVYYLLRDRSKTWEIFQLAVKLLESLYSLKIRNESEIEFIQKFRLIFELKTEIADLDECRLKLMKEGTDRSESGDAESDKAITDLEGYRPELMKEGTDRSESGDAESGNVTCFKRILLHIGGFFYWLLNLFNAQGQASTTGTTGGERQRHLGPTELTPNPPHQGSLIASR